MSDTSLETVRLASQPEARGPGRWRVSLVGEAGYSTYALPPAGAVTVGRGDDVEIRVDDAAASRRHAQLLTSSAGVRLVDLGSANGTVVRGRKLAANQEIALSAGDSIEVGTTVLVLQPDFVSGPARPWTLLTHADFVDVLEDTRPPFAVLRLQVQAPPGVAHEVLSAELSPHDTVATFGPGNFEILAPGRAPDAATQLLQKLSSKLVQRGARVRGGSATAPADGTSADALFAACARPSTSPSPGFVVRDDAMAAISRLVDRIAPSMINVLILGETGSGKEVLAREIHRRSKRSNFDMLSLNCAALTETLLESELFGHERGSFTGAVKDKVGLLEAATGSTVFLDEVGEIPPSIQAKLLRVLEERRVLRVGAVTPVPIDVRFIFATNRDLEAEVARGAFRADLFYRINGISIELPPLRDRPGEIEPLARTFLAEAARRDGVPTPDLSPHALAALRSYPWPGNIRELKNVIDRAILLSGGGVIDTEALGLFGVSPGTPARTATAVSAAPRLKAEREAAERMAVEAALAQTGGNQTRAARLLGISRRTLVSRLTQYGLTRPRRKGGGPDGGGESPE
ncbi:MAG: sigma 54-interacting transcriptional regulator [Myxococcota bacterium]